MPNQLNHTRCCEICGLAVIRELRAILPAQLEHEGLAPIQVNVVAGGPVVPYRPDEE